MSPMRKPRLGPGELIILIVMALLALIVITGNLGMIVEKLYSPVIVVIVVVMLVEYLLLKGSDRSAIYRRERDAAREKRRNDLLAMRQMETRLVDLRADMRSALDRESQDSTVLHQMLEEAVERTDEVIGLIREQV